ncbi:MAG: photosystem reaction center protein [Sphingomonas bacterium]|nr:PRC-barrel domain-containing protein [Sphingomonas bacterium]MDB5688356.1 photosystem reaction center protein [Sphingomonas bacterium]
MTDILPDPVTDPHHELISSTRVEGTPVRNLAGKKLGIIHSVMIHKVSGRVSYALLAFDRFLGVPEFVYPIPWEKLTYDLAVGGYVVDLTREMLEAAPSLSLDAAARPSDRATDEALFGYYGATMFW